MKNFNEKREEAKKVFFNNHNYIKCEDFVYDFFNDKLLPRDVKRSSTCSFVSFREYAAVFGTDDIFALIKEEYSYDGTKEYFNRFEKKVGKIFDSWFETFYNNVKNSGYDILDEGTQIAYKYERLKH